MDQKLEIDRKLRSLLRQWADGNVDEQEVHADAEYLFEQLQELTQRPDDTNVGSLLYEALSHLSFLPQQLIIKDDIIVILNFLDTPPDMLEEGWKNWYRYWDDELDYAQRRHILSDNLYYSTYKFPSES
jgi:hypothetical protein